jgi:hypothetical protein
MAVLGKAAARTVDEVRHPRTLVLGGPIIRSAFPAYVKQFPGAGAYSARRPRDRSFESLLIVG